MRRPPFFNRISTLLFLSCSFLGTPSFAQESSAQDPKLFQKLIGQLENTRIGNLDEWLTQCVNSSFIDRTELIQKLQSLGINLHDPYEKLDNDLLLFLYAYFKTVDVPRAQKLLLEPRDESSPQLVKTQTDAAKTVTRIQFSKNASEGLFGKNFSDAVQEKLKKGEDPRVRLTISFKNTLFEQLTAALGTPDSLKTLLKTRYGVEVGASDGSPDKSFEHEMSARELSAVIKQFADLPPALVSHLALKRIVRMKPGFTNGNVNADYSPALQTMRIFDSTFSQQDIVEGEGTIVHELGHALWKGLAEETKREFIKLSWSLDGASWRIQLAQRNFVSPYSQKNPEEDFAEHFSAYVNSPERLKAKAPDKYRFFRSYLFPDTEYFSDIPKNAKDEVVSACPDSRPPTLDGSLEDLLKVTALVDEKDPEYMNLTCEISKLKDDISGIESLSFNFEVADPSIPDSAAEESKCWMSLQNGDCVDAGKGVYRRTEQYKRDNVYEGLHKLDYAIATDRAGNQIHIPVDRLRFLFPGKKLRAQERGPTHSIQKEATLRRVRISPSQVQGISEETYRVEIPIEHPSDIESLSITVLHNGVGKDLEFEAKGTMFASKPGDKSIITSLVFPKEYERGEMEIVGMKLTLAKTPSENRAEYLVKVPNNLPNLKFRINPSEPDLTRPEVDLSRLVFRQVDQKDLPAEILERYPYKEQGRGWLEFSVPALGVEEEKIRHLEIGAYLQLPNGEGLYIRGEPVPVMENGKKIYRFYSDLRPNHQAGTYLIQTIQLKENYQDRLDITGKEQIEQRLGSASGVAHPKYKAEYLYFKKEEVKLLERGIRRSIDVR